ncbi:MAG: hypothetical protein ACON3Z_16025 [Bradymonadia bacterium]
MARLYLCKGSDCRKKKRHTKQLVQIMNDVEVVPVRCQKICSGPVVGLELGGTLVWFKKMRKKKDAEALANALSGAPLTKRLTSRLVRKRSGRLR